MTSSKDNMNRRRFMQVVVGSAAAMALPQIPLNAAETAGPQRPNILWISPARPRASPLAATKKFVL